MTTKSNITKKALLKALEKSLGVVTVACKNVGIDRSTFYKWVKEDKEFARRVEEIENVSLDFVESKLFNLISEGNPAATIFYLKTKGKKRGYVERQEITGADGRDIKINFKDAT